MYSSRIATVLAALAVARATVVPEAKWKRQSGTVDPGTVKGCTFFTEYPSINFPSQGDTCESIADYWGISVADFKRYNPVVGNDCKLQSGYSYCVEAPPPATTSTTVTSTTTSTTTSKSPTTTSGPSPTQPGITDKCAKYYQAVSGDTCGAIVDKYNAFTLDDFFRWNPAVQQDCTRLLGGYYYCIQGPNPTKPTTTTTKPPASCYTNAPDPVQPGAVCNCDKWHRLASSTGTCNDIIKYENIYAEDFYKWNPKIGGTACTGLWQGYFTCVHVPGAKKPPTEQPCHPNAPSPVQPGAVCNCKKWHYVKKVGATCEEVINYEHVKADDFYRWNPKIGGKACTGLWQGYYVCVGV